MQRQEIIGYDLEYADLAGHEHAGHTQRWFPAKREALGLSFGGRHGNYVTEATATARIFSKELQLHGRIFTLILRLQSAIARLALPTRYGTRAMGRVIHLNYLANFSISALPAVMSAKTRRTSSTISISARTCKTTEVSKASRSTRPPNSSIRLRQGA